MAVLNRPFSERYGVEFVLEFADVVEFRKVDIVEGIAQFFGDSSASNVILKSVSDHKVVWLNKSLAYAGCDDPEVRREIIRIIRFSVTLTAVLGTQNARSFQTNAKNSLTQPGPIRITHQ